MFVSRSMTRRVVTAGPNTSVFEAQELMSQHGVRHLPVVDENHHVIGMVSVRDLYAFVLEEMSEDLRAQTDYIHGESYGVAAH